MHSEELSNVLCTSQLPSYYFVYRFHKSNGTLAKFSTNLFCNEECAATSRQVLEMTAI